MLINFEQFVSDLAQICSKSIRALGLLNIYYMYGLYIPSSIEKHNSISDFSPVFHWQLLTNEDTGLAFI